MPRLISDWFCFVLWYWSLNSGLLTFLRQVLYMWPLFHIFCFIVVLEFELRASCLLGALPFEPLHQLQIYLFFLFFSGVGLGFELNFMLAKHAFSWATPPVFNYFTCIVQWHFKHVHIVVHPLPPSSFRTLLSLSDCNSAPLPPSPWQSPFYFLFLYILPLSHTLFVLLWLTLFHFILPLVL
jgi:hypothetical protein